MYTYITVLKIVFVRLPPSLSLSLSLSLSPALFIRCTKCNNYDGPLETPSVINEKGASVMAAYSNVDSKFVRVLY